MHYDGEVCGFRRSLSEVSTNIGIVLGSLVGLLVGGLVPNPDMAWRIMLGLGGVFPVAIIALTLFFLPETPRWLMEKGRQREAQRVMACLCGDEDEARATMQELQEAMEREQAAGDMTWKQMLWRPSPGVQLMVTVVVVVGIAQQLVGADIVTVFTPIILEDQAHLSSSAARAVFFVLTVWKTLMVAVAAALLDSASGRRPLLLASFAGIALSHTLIAAGFTAGSVATNVAGLLLFVTFFSLGIGPVAWLLASEVLPTNMRAKGMMLACSFNRLFAGLSLLVFLNAEGGSGAPSNGTAAFVVLATLSSCFFGFTYLLVPETKCRTLEEMTEHFEREAKTRGGMLRALRYCWPVSLPPEVLWTTHPPRQRSLHHLDEGEEDRMLGGISLTLADGNADTWNDACLGSNHGGPTACTHPGISSPTHQ
mmetsp:Transcript_27189/g.76697  ORF Transcript_27189/g.76697 Transcript_27189/m.76697 type:complete len:424 (+) Transcript_27189:680-1951(+)